MAAWVEWLGNTHPPWAAYRALMACRLVALDKQPGVRPVGIGEVHRRLLAKLVVAAAGSDAIISCGSANLCAGLSAGIEGALHAMVDAPAYLQRQRKEDAAPLQPPGPAEGDDPSTDPPSPSPTPKHRSPIAISGIPFPWPAV